MVVVVVVNKSDLLKEDLNSEKRKARRENINFINFWGGVSGKAVTTISSSFSSSSEKKLKKKKLKKQKQVMADVITIIV